MLDSVLSTGLVNGYSTTTERLQTTLPQSQSQAQWFRLFRPLTKHQANKWFTTDACVKHAVNSCLQTLDTDLFYARTQTLLPQWDKFLNILGNYTEVWWVPSVADMPNIHYCLNTVLSIRAFVTSFSETPLYIHNANISHTQQWLTYSQGEWLSMKN